VADVEGAAQRLLRALNENQAHSREGAVVEPGEQEARDAGLRPGSSLYRAAVWWLLDKGALVPDREANSRARKAAGAQHRDFAVQDHPTRPGHAARGVTGGAGERRCEERGPVLVMCGTMLVTS
jgi:hypothetical protein